MPKTSWNATKRVIIPAEKFLRSNKFTAKSLNFSAFDDEPLDDEDEDDFTVIAPKQTIIGPQPLNSYITPRDQVFSPIH